MTNFTLYDVAGGAVAVVVYLLALFIPGYVLGFASNLFGFRRMTFRKRVPWAIAYSFAVTPLASYLVAKYAGLRAGCTLLLALALVGLWMVWRDRRALVWSRGETITACGVGLWVAFVFLSLVDIQMGHKLYFSEVVVDQGYRVAFTDAILRTGVPPANPLYFGGQAQPMRYYYFWYVICAMVARLGHIGARQAFLASSVWAGFGLVAMLSLYARHFLGVVEGLRRQTLILTALLAVTGADLIPAIGSIFGQVALNGEMEWWSNDQISSWMDSTLWVPHHVASLLCCLFSFLLLWMSRTAASGGQRIAIVVLAAIAFASGFGLSIYVAFGFGVLMLAWTVRVLVVRRRGSVLAGSIVAMGLLATLLLVPFLSELTTGLSQTAGGSSEPTHLFAVSIRRMIDPVFLTGLPIFAAWDRAHPILLDQVARLLLLLPGLALELGFYGAVLWLCCKYRKRYPADGPERTAIFLAGWGLVLILFVRSDVIGNNDFGYRAALLPQFFLLLLGADLLASWWIKGHTAVVQPTPWRKKLLYGLIGLGVAGTAYQVVMLRIFLPLEAGRPDSGFMRLPAQAFAARRALVDLDRVSSQSAVLEFNPIDPDPDTRGDVASPYMFYSRLMLMDAPRQFLSAEPQCAIEFGGKSGSCAAIESATRRLYVLPAPSAQWAEDYCRQFGAAYLAVSDMDHVWNDASGWPSTLPSVASEQGFRIVRCSGETGAH